MNESLDSIDNKIGPILAKLEFHVNQNKRYLGYNNNLPIIELLKALGIWEELGKESSNQFFNRISEIFGIPRTNLYNWQKKLQENKDWLPDHSKTSDNARVFTPDQYVKLQNLISKMVQSRNIAIKNRFISAITNFFYNSLEDDPQENLHFNSLEHYVI